MSDKIVKLRPVRRQKTFDGIQLREKPKTIGLAGPSGKARSFRSGFPLPGSTLQAGFALVLLAAGLASGLWFGWQTPRSAADMPQVLGATDAAPQNLAAEKANAMAEMSEDDFYRLTVSQLEEYLSEAIKTPAMKEAELLADRKTKLKAYLADKRSPFVEIADSLAELRHWKMVLAISNSESTLGKRCHSNNCSGIGVAPGHPLWREYASTRDWAKDLDRLLERRYKDWTLEQMNGVYNQPGSKNWVRAARQVLEELQARGIQ